MCGLVSVVLVLVVGLFHVCWGVSVNSVVLFTTHFTLSYSGFSGFGWCLLCSLLLHSRFDFGLLIVILFGFMLVVLGLVVA